MAGMKITPTSAMRARDVSRPRTEHLAAAAEREEAATRHRNGPPNAATPGKVPPKTTPPKTTPPVGPVPPKPPTPSDVPTPAQRRPSRGC
jgi:hypothetical protein